MLIWETRRVCWFAYMVYRALLAYLAAFTLLDALVTAVGLSVGCVELNPVVTALGVPVWAVLRILLLGYMLTVFFAGYRFCFNRFHRGVWALGTTLFALDLYIGTVVFSGFFAIYARLAL
ncbi:MAG: DUF5658 family protein [Candidatus Bathycorpusculaceae bacterium]